MKENMKYESKCCEKKDNFNYHEIENALCGKRYLNKEFFTPKRILVIQMI